MRSLIPALCVTAICAAQPFEPLKARAPWRPDPTLPRRDIAWERLLENNEVRFLTDNQLSVSLDGQPGLARVDYYPVRQRVVLKDRLEYPKLAKETQFQASAARVSFLDASGAPLKLAETGYRWLPHLVERVWSGEGREIRERITVSGNLAAVSLSQTRGPATAVEARGAFPYSYWSEEAAGRQSFCFANGVCIAPFVAGGAPFESLPDGYRARFALDRPVMMLLATGYRPEDVAAEVNRVAAQPDSAFDQSRRTWDFYFTAMVPRLQTANAALDRLYYYLFYVVRSSLFDIPWEPYQHAYSCPWKTGAIWQWSWNTPMNAIAERWLNDSSLSKEGIRLIARNGGAMYFGTYLHPVRAPSPRLDIFGWYREVDEAQNKVEPKDYYFLSVMPYTVPNSFLGVWEVYRMTGDQEFLRQNIPLMAAYEEASRRRAKPGSLITPFQMMVDEFDYSLRWKPVQATFTKGGLQRAFDVPVEMADVNAYLVELRRMLAEAYALTGEGAKAREMSLLADRSASEVNERLWDRKLKFYCDARADTGASTGVRAISGFAPLYVGIVPEDRRQAVLEALDDPQAFAAPYPIPSVELRNPDIDPGLLTYGGDSLITTGVWTVVNALVRNGQPGRAARYVERAVDMVTKDGPSSSYSYNSLTGKPNQRKHQLSTQCAILNDLIARYVVGLAPRNDDVFEFNPIASSLAGGRMEFGPFRYKDRHWVEVRLSGTEWRVSVDGASVAFPRPQPVLLRLDGNRRLRPVKR